MTLAIARYDERYLADLLKDLVGHADRWRAIAQFPRDGRWWQRLDHTDEIDIWLLTWRTGHSTDLHDHGGSAGAFAVVQGELTEIRVSADRQSSRSTIIAAGETSQIQASTVHDVYNGGPAAAISLHAYSPPLSHQTFYELGSAGYHPTNTVRTRIESAPARGGQAA
jgi:predicted metal-dependent enzyme (double-stranded beta helix superfamily)